MVFRVVTCTPDMLWESIFRPDEHTDQPEQEYESMSRCKFTIFLDLKSHWKSGIAKDNTDQKCSYFGSNSEIFSPLDE